MRHKFIASRMKTTIYPAGSRRTSVMATCVAASSVCVLCLVKPVNTLLLLSFHVLDRARCLVKLHMSFHLSARIGESAEPLTYAPETHPKTRMRR